MVGWPSTTPVAKQELVFTKTVTLDGQLITGGAMFRTMTRCRHPLVLPLMSLATQRTRLVPTGKLEGALLNTLASPQLSFAVGVPRATFEATFVPGSVSAKTSEGHVMVGGV